MAARRNGVAPNLLYRWQRLMLEGGSVAVAGDDDVTSNRVVRQLEDRVRELERHLGRKTQGPKSRVKPWTSRAQENRPCSRGRRWREISDESGGGNP